MGINRRTFLQAMGLTGLTLAVGNESRAAQFADNEIEFNAILCDSTLCEGCQSCEFACAEANNLPEPADYPEPGVVRNIDENRRSVINCYETSKGQVYVKKQCMHCNEPACASACLTNAMEKTLEGPVIWRGDKCMGCRYCMISCPFDIPKFEFDSPNPRIQKCDMCFGRLADCKMPACVENCPAGALTYGKRRDLIREARRRIHDDPGRYVDYIYGEHEAGGTSFLYLSGVPFEELGFNTSIQKSSYPELTRGFLYSVPTIFVLWPTILLGIHHATRDNHLKEAEND
ncbi:MAG TPA: 4Fe-4S dicluster domain-containing protein [Bacteroidales bacterium]|nr:4Fe-4S dicluster domain-containing protein [Bacteroidales bacterium]